MSAAIRTHAVLFLAAVLFAAGSAEAADPGWVAFKNDTGRVIVVQEIITVNGRARRCRPVRLLPGESFREMQSARTMTVEVFDGQAPIKSLCTDTVPIKSENQTFSVAARGAAVVITPTSGR